MGIENVIIIIGISLSFIVGAAGLIIGIRNSKRTIYINSVTTSRIKYMQELRDNISEFSGLFYRYHLLVKKNKDLSTEKFEILAKTDKLKYLIKLYLNPEDTYWDNQMINLIDNIRESIDENPKDKIDQLIIITQYLLKLEWEGAKAESRKGNLSKKFKGKLYQEYVRLHKKHIHDLAISKSIDKKE